VLDPGAAGRGNSHGLIRGLAYQRVSRRGLSDRRQSPLSGTYVRRWGARGTLALVALVTALLVTLPAVAGARVKPRMRHVSLLYVVNAGGGTLAPRPERRFTLTLRALEPSGVWFSDRPARRSGTFPSRLLPAGWKGLGFASAPPNAALVYSTGADRPGSTVILRLGHPRSSRGGHAISFTAKMLNPATVRSPALTARVQSAASSPPRRFAHASLFIDDGIAPVISGCILQPYTQCEGADLQGADLHGAQLMYANFAGANLNDATLAGADLSFDNLAKARLQIATLAGANLTDASLAFADMPGANLGGANLTGATLDDALDTAANYGGATFCRTILPNGSVSDSGC
jgi:hypothetical protein